MSHLWQSWKLCISLGFRSNFFALLLNVYCIIYIAMCEWASINYVHFWLLSQDLYIVFMLNSTQLFIMSIYLDKYYPLRLILPSVRSIYIVYYVGLVRDSYIHIFSSLFIQTAIIWITFMYITPDLNCIWVLVFYCWNLIIILYETL